MPQPQPTTPNEQAPKLPGLLNIFVAPFVRHGLTVAAGMLAAHGFLATNQEDQFKQVAFSIVIAGLGYGWSVYQKHNAKADLVQALNSPPVEEPVS